MRAVALGVLTVAGLALAQQGCGVAGTGRYASPVAFIPPQAPSAVVRIVSIRPDGGPAVPGSFVLTPVGDKFQIGTAGGLCLGVKVRAVREEVCDAGQAGQLFTIVRRGSSYTIGNGSSFLQGGLTLGNVPSTFSFGDSGPAG